MSRQIIIEVAPFDEAIGPKSNTLLAAWNDLHFDSNDFSLLSEYMLFLWNTLRKNDLHKLIDGIRIRAVANSERFMHVDESEIKSKLREWFENNHSLEIIIEFGSELAFCLRGKSTTIEISRENKFIIATYNTSSNGRKRDIFLSFSCGEIIIAAIKAIYNLVRFVDLSSPQREYADLLAPIETKLTTLQGTCGY